MNTRGCLVRATRKVIFILAALFVVATIIIVLIRWEYRTVARLDAGHGFRIEVVEDTPWHTDPLPCCYYEVHRGSETIVDKCMIGCDGGDKITLDLLKTTDGTLVALIERANPDIVLALFDTQTLATWPRQGDSESRGDVHDRGVALLARLQESHRNTTLKLGDRGLLGRTD